MSTFTASAWLRVARLCVAGCLLSVPLRRTSAEQHHEDSSVPLRETGVSDPLIAPRDAEPLPLGVFDHGDPSLYEQLMLEYVNRARAAPGAEATRLGIGLNDGIDSNPIEDTPKPPLSFHPFLIDAARDHSQWMIDTDTFSHIGVDSSTPSQRMERAGYVFSGSWALGENISWGGSTGSIDIETYTVARHDALFRSPGHRQNLCFDMFDEIGIGLIAGPFTSDGTTYNVLMATQKFALSGSTPSPRILGVVYGDGNANDFYDIGEGWSNVAVSVESNAWSATTSSSGGYAVPYEGETGTVTLVFSGQPLPAPVRLRVPKTGRNIKVDLDTETVARMAFAAQDLEETGEGFRMRVQGHAHVRFDMQYSTNVMDWTTVGQYDFNEGETWIAHQPSAAVPAHFYRLRWSD